MKYIAIALLLLLAAGCKKLNPLSNINNILQTLNDSIPAAVSGIGTATGTPVSKTIGSSGGSLISADGRIELAIPAGALSGNTNITIQPVTNTCPGGLGVAYDLQPNGTKFAIPATFTFHYGDSDINGSDPYLLFEAVQDSLQQWDADVYRDVDTIAKTVSFDLNHFSIRSMLPGIVLDADPDVTIQANGHKLDYYPSEIGTLRLVQSVRDGQLQEPAGGDDDALSTLPVSTPVQGNLVSNWSVDGGISNGTVAPNGSQAVYTAPSKIDKDKKITVSVAYGKGGYVYVPHRKSKAHESVQRSIPVYRIALNLHPANISFSVTVTVDLTGTSDVYDDKYHDECTFRVDVKSGQVSIPQDGIQNQAPTVTPSSGNGGGSKAEWVSDNVGLINITGGQGVVTPPDSAGYRVVALTFTEPGTLGPGWKTTNSQGYTSTVQPYSQVGVPMTMSFEMKDEFQTIDPLEGTKAAGEIKITITPIH